MAKTAAAVKEEPPQEPAAPAQQSADTAARAEQGLPPKGTQYVPTPKADQIRQLPADRWKLREQANAEHTITMELGTTMEDVAKPAYFAHIAAKLTPYDKIIVRADDGKIYGELLVLAVSHAWVKTYPLHWVDLDKVNASVSAKGAESMSGFTIEHKGPHLQWCVVRKNPSGIVHSGEPDEERARSWLLDYLKATRVQTA